MSGKISEKLCKFTFLIIILSAIPSISALDYPDFVGYVNDMRISSLHCRRPL